MTNNRSDHPGKLWQAVLLTFAAALGSGYMNQFLRNHFAPLPGAGSPTETPPTDLVDIPLPNGWKTHTIAKLVIVSPIALQPVNLRLEPSIPASKWGMTNKAGSDHVAPASDRRSALSKSPDRLAPKHRSVPLAWHNEEQSLRKDLFR